MMDYYPHAPEDFGSCGRISALPMVYVISTSDFKFIKVGHSSNFKNRIRNIQSGCPLDLAIWCSIRTPISEKVESSLHSVLAHCSIRGEWFSPSMEDLDSVLVFCEKTNQSVKEAHRALLQA